MKTQIFLLLCFCSYLVLLNAYHLRKQEEIDPKATADANADAKLKEASLKKLANDIKNDYLAALESQRDIENENKRMTLMIKESELAQNLKVIESKNKLIESQKKEEEDLIKSYNEDMKTQKKSLYQYIEDRRKKLEDQLEELNKQLYDFELEEKANCDKELSKLVDTAEIEYKNESESLLKQNKQLLEVEVEEGKKDFINLKKSNELKKEKVLEICDSTKKGLEQQLEIEPTKFSEIIRDVYSGLAVTQ